MPANAVENRCLILIPSLTQDLAGRRFTSQRAMMSFVMKRTVVTAWFEPKSCVISAAAILAMYLMMARKSPGNVIA